MKGLRKNDLIVFLVLLISGSLQAKTEVITEAWFHKNIYHNNQALKFAQRIQDYVVTLQNGDQSFGRKSTLRLIVEDPKTLEQYAFIQFIKGQVYTLETLPSGETRRYNNYKKYILGELLPFNFKNWVVDSPDLDPILGSHPSQTQSNYYYKVSKYIEDIDIENFQYLGQKNSSSKFFYLNYFSPQFFTDGNSTKVVDTIFQSCLVEISKPDRLISCFYWNANSLVN